MLEPRDLRDLGYLRALGCSVPSVAWALLRARGYSKSRRSRRKQYLTDLDYNNVTNAVKIIHCASAVATGSYWRVFLSARAGILNARGRVF